MSTLQELRSGEISPTLDAPKDTTQTKAFDGKQIIELERWQDYVFFGALFVTTCALGKEALNGNLGGTATKGWVGGTLVMGKIYTDDALNKYSLSVVTRSLEGHVLTLAEQVDHFATQLEESRRLTGHYGELNDYHQKTNFQQHQLNMQMFAELTEHRQEVAERKKDVTALLKEIASGNLEKQKITEELDRAKIQLAMTTKKLSEEAERLVAASKERDGLLVH